MRNYVFSGRSINYEGARRLSRNIWASRHLHHSPWHLKTKQIEIYYQWHIRMSCGLPVPFWCELFNDFPCDMSPYLLLVLYAITADTEAQWPDKRLKADETCKTDLGNSGMCVQVKDCPAAIQLIQERGRPKICRFDGLNPIVCCEIPNVDNVITKLGEFGSVAKQSKYRYSTNKSTHIK